MKTNNIDFKACDEIGTIIYVALENKFVGYIVISDKIKQDSFKAIQNLKSNNINNLVILTGDKKSVGESVAKELGINTVYAELLPTQKAEKLETIIKQKPCNSYVAFVGDGINDSPVLALADVGIAMGALGSDSAIEAADVVIMTDEPSKICDTINFSKKTMKIVKQNIVFAISIKLIVLLLSAFGYSTMWAAVFADVGVCLISILNSLRALKVSFMQKNAL